MYAPFLLERKKNFEENHGTKFWEIIEYYYA